MKIFDYTDLRVKKTISAIHSAFEELICEVDYEKITVTELTKRAQINKKTFYRYYPSLSDLLAEFQEMYANAYIDLIKDYHLPEDLDMLQTSFFHFSNQQGQAYDKITVSQSSYTDIRDDMIDMVMASTWSQTDTLQHLSNFKKVALLNFLKQTSLTIYQQWVEEGKKTPIDEVIQTSILLTQSGLNTLISQK